MEQHEGERAYRNVVSFTTEGGVYVSLDHENFDYTMTVPDFCDQEHLYDVEEHLRSLGLMVDDYEPAALTYDESFIYVLVPIEPDPEELEVWEGPKPISLSRVQGKHLAGLVLAGLSAFAAMSSSFDSVAAVLPT